MSACVGPRPPAVAAFLGDGLVERRHPAAGLLQLRPQRLEGGAVVLLQRGEPLQHLRREGRAGIGRGLLDQPVQRIADFLGRVDGGGDQVLGFDRYRRRSSRALLDARRAAQQQVVEIHALRRAGDAHAPALRASSARRNPAPPPRRVRRHRRARSRRARRSADRERAARRSKENSPSENCEHKCSLSPGPGKEKMTIVKEKMLNAKKEDKKHMNAGACEVKPLHLAMGFREAVAEHFPGHYTGPPEPKEMGQWKLFIAKLPQHHAGHVMELCLSKWYSFATVAVSEAGLSSTPDFPSVGFLLQHVITAVNFYIALVEAEGEEGLQAGVGVWSAINCNRSLDGLTGR